MNDADWTIEAWVKHDPDNPNRPQVSDIKQLGQPNGPSIAISKEMMSKLEVDKWHHVSAVRANGNVRMFVNGEPIKNVATVTRRGGGKFIVTQGEKKILFPDRESLIVHITKMRILHPEIGIIGDIDE